MLIAGGAHYGGGRVQAESGGFLQGNKSALMNRQQRRGRDQAQNGGIGAATKACSAQEEKKTRTFFVWPTQSIVNGRLTGVVSARFC